MRNPNNSPLPTLRQAQDAAAHPSSGSGHHRLLPTALIQTLGCKVNRYDSDQLALEFSRCGFAPVANHHALDRDPDVVIINTCCVTTESERKSRQLIRRFARRYPSARIIVTGCAAVLDLDGLAGMPEVNEVCSIVHQRELALRVAHDFGLAEKPEPVPEMPHDRTRAFVKVQEGCDLFCSYCSIPYSRGEPRSRAIEEVRGEITHLLENGFREVVLCGTRLGAYGRDIGTTLVQLLENLCSIEKIDRLRLSSLEPEDLDPVLVDLISAEETVCPHLHLPLQSGSDRILEQMGRGYRRSDYLRNVELAYERIRDLCISTDIMVGFPGETDEDFADTLAMVEQCRFSKVHSFPFSPRPKTPAADLPSKVPHAVSKQRRIALDRIALNKAEEVRSTFIGRKMPVLVETCEDGFGTGLTPNYLRVRFPLVSGLLSNTVVLVTLEKAEGLRMSGTIAE
ncbi:MAG: tRNA (N(6)-L-threonylcarbamoyladenosine(37)-C(2))-methylthiotransferase MtaB [bacterium]